MDQASLALMSYPMLSELLVRFELFLLLCGPKVGVTPNAEREPLMKK